MTVPPIETIPLSVHEHGTIRVGGTRVPLDTVIHAFLRGSSPEDIVDQFDVLSLRDVYLTIGYYLSHRTEVDDYLTQREQEAIAFRKAHEHESLSMKDFREQLLARRAAAAMKDHE